MWQSIMYISYTGCTYILKNHQTIQESFVLTSLEREDEEKSTLHPFVKSSL